MSVRHEELQALAAGYVLDALEPGERRVFERHLASCPSCAADVESLRRAAEALVRAVPQRIPPPDLRERVLSAIAAEHAWRGPVHRQARELWRDARIWIPVVALLLLAVVTTSYALRLRLRVVQLEAQVAQLLQQSATVQRQLTVARRDSAEAQSAWAVLAAPDLVRIDLAAPEGTSPARGRALWSRQRGMVFSAASLPALPGGRVYQVWVVTARAPISAGLLTPLGGGALAVFLTPPDIPAPIAIAVTLEPAGGVSSPTGPKVLLGTPPSS